MQVVFSVGVGPNQGLTITLHFTPCGIILISFLACVLYFMHCVFEEGLLRPIIRVLFGPGVWA